jgi:Archaeal Nre, N-terminal
MYFGIINSLYEKGPVILFTYFLGVLLVNENIYNDGRQSKELLEKAAGL